MKLKPVASTDDSAVMNFNGGGGHVITIHCEDVTEDAPRIARAVNTFEAVVSALTPFRSSEMGGLLIDIIDMREPNGAEAQRRFTHLINMIDVILDAAEAPDEADAA